MNSALFIMASVNLGQT